MRCDGRARRLVLAPLLSLALPPATLIATPIATPTRAQESGSIVMLDDGRTRPTSDSSDSSHCSGGGPVGRGSNRDEQTNMIDVAMQTKLDFWRAAPTEPERCATRSTALWSSFALLFIMQIKRVSYASRSICQTERLLKQSSARKSPTSGPSNATDRSEPARRRARFVALDSSRKQEMKSSVGLEIQATR